ncbi:tetraspanin-8 [Pipistrellus kuhlii]|uniref:tetraspanin-8 n=1 Tax=Pipistrellus kuhlii TaxID=59472 RepID=UPI00174F34B1|nr:tetraspanin-8 [Pipistrellus kuhlii]
MAGVTTCIKYSMFIFNFFFWLCGILILGLAIWIRVSRSEIEFPDDYNTSYNTSANILIGVGTIIVILGFLGFCGTLRESRCMLLTFFIGLLLVLLVQMVAGILGVTYKFQYEHVLNETLYKNVDLLTEAGEKAKLLQKSLIIFQKKYKCCGLIDGASDWGTNFLQNSESCECSDMTDSACETYEGKLVYKRACIGLIKEFIRKHITMVIGITFGEAAVEVFGLIFSMVLFCRIGNKLI